MQFLSEEYLLLFNALTDAETTLAQLQAALMAAQQRAEELYLQRTESDGEQKSAG